jgi:hypothetical protein
MTILRSTVLSGWTAAWAAMLLTGGQALADAAEPVTHMADELRESISRIVILPIPGESGEAITGTYDQETRGLYGGVAKGAEIGQVPVEVGHVPINIPIPVLREIGMIVGGITGSMERRTQDLRDHMTEDLASAVEQPLSNVALATDVFWGLREIESVEPKLFSETTPIPQGTDAILYINLDEVTLNIQKDEAIISTVATARLQSQADGSTLYRTTASYADRDQLKNWAKNDFALWGEYREFARHYLGRELISELYARIKVDHTMEPVYGSGGIKPDKKDPWHGETKSVSPTLAWTYHVADAVKDEIDASKILWEVEIYDAQRPVYLAQRVAGTEFKLDVALEPCKTYRWSVRPAYAIDGRTKYGAWMRKGSETAGGNGNVGRAISVAHAYMQDFASFEVDCRAR